MIHERQSTLTGTRLEVRSRTRLNCIASYSFAVPRDQLARLPPGNERKHISMRYAKQLEVQIRPTKLGAKKIDGSNLSSNGRQTVREEHVNFMKRNSKSYRCGRLRSRMEGCNALHSYKLERKSQERQPNGYLLREMTLGQTCTNQCGQQSVQTRPSPFVGLVGIMNRKCRSVWQTVGMFTAYPSLQVKFSKLIYVLQEKHLMQG